MERDPQKLLDAARILKEQCKNTDTCDEHGNCLFYDRDSGHCLIKTYPTNWDLDKIEEVIR